MARFTVFFVFKRKDVGAAKPILSPFAKIINPIELKVFFLEIVHLGLYSGKVWGFSIVSFCTPPDEILGRLLLINADFPAELHDSY